MTIVRSIEDLNLDHTRSIGFVPTMGAFHEGHLSLIRMARRENEQAVVSLFVNPAQFGPGEDYRAYPREEVRDACLAEAEGVDILFAPEVGEIYPRRTTTVVPSGVAKPWEGERRPGHFEGVATVVAKLFNIIRPTIAYFGLKDFQQCAVISQMVEDMNWPVRLRFAETVREAGGLAMSSRNVYLSPEQRNVASLLYRELWRLSGILEGANRRRVDVELRSARITLEDAGFRVDYVEMVDERTLEPSAPNIGSCRIIAAVHLGATRLIDNVAIRPAP